MLNGVVAEAFVDHMALPGTGPGLGGLKEAVTIFRTGLPDMNIIIAAVVVEDNLVAVRQVTTGTHLGDFLEVPASGAELSFTAFDMYRVQDGFIVESWHVEDLLVCAYSNRNICGVTVCPKLDNCGFAIICEP